MATSTYDTNNDVQDRAVLVSLVTDDVKRGSADPEHSLAELVSLAETAGVRVLTTITQNRETPDSKWFIGKGKVEELRAAASELGATTAIFDQELSGAQVRNLEEALDLKIIDRTQLILDIFAGRAKTREGIIQVELAQLSYLLPRLSGHGKNLSRLGGGIGTRGPGESKLETDRRHIRNRIAELKRQLDEVVRHRKLHRERRKKSGVIQVALVGYTNAGKSTLLRELTEADVYVENQLFATLDPTSRNWQLPNGKEIVLTDTVGFIQNLPHDLVAAFRATLEEVNEADLILHVVDSSSPMRSEQMAVVADILTQLGAGDKQQLTVFNKKDLCTEESSHLLAGGKDALFVSAYSEPDLQQIREAVQQRLTGDTLTFGIPADRGDLIALAYRSGEVLGQDVGDDDGLVSLTVRLNKQEYELNGHKLQPYIRL
ncbi:GTP-binding protein HflX [Paenibacillus darwinianus]|uniref:GTPase HflX n=1 Tax=Paenibacillus darwinianus TaxID=1380763 RepID=A0A9W5S1W5_9BACL|nr:GTPase HflX [Paenibacillus darwinianus]EXX89826.1 GTP-binding protein HflX [Paenibacillus darwinianus]EXX90210.1 GTP-binding protein HflX [Paenibacillus darwinianus]EXX90632.1 GTP-binding protein HflX [Paenibacillus darwinianus]